MFCKDKYFPEVQIKLDDFKADEEDNCDVSKRDVRNNFEDNFEEYEDGDDEDDDVIISLFWKKLN